jgi:hypothetical protein
MHQEIRDEVVHHELQNHLVEHHWRPNESQWTSKIKKNMLQHKKILDNKKEYKNTRK